MGLEEIIKNIDLETKARAKQLNDESIVAARKIEDEAEDQASSYLDEQKAKADNDAKQLLMREMSRANIEAKGIYQKAVNDVINESFDALYGNLNEYTESTDYSKLLAKLAKTATDELGAGCRIILNKKDVQKMKGTAKDITIEESKEDFVGGLRATSKDGKMYVDYSLGKIIESLKEQMAVKLLDLIKG